MRALNSSVDAGGEHEPFGDMARGGHGPNPAKNLLGVGDRLRREHRGEVEQVQRPDAFDLRGEPSPGLLREARLPAAHGDLVPNGVNELGWHTDDQHLPDPFGATG